MGSTHLLNDFLRIGFAPDLALYDLWIKPYDLGWQLITKDFTEQDLVIQNVIYKQFPRLESNNRLITVIAGCVLMCPLLNTITVIFFRYYFKNSTLPNSFFTPQGPVDIDTTEVTEEPTSPLPPLEKSQISMKQSIDETAVAVTFYWPSEFDSNRSHEVKKWILNILKKGGDWITLETPDISPIELLQLESCISQINFSDTLKEKLAWITKIISNTTSHLKAIMDQFFQNYSVNINLALLIVPYKEMGIICFSSIQLQQLEQLSINLVKDELKKLEGKNWVDPILCIAAGIYLMEKSKKSSEDFTAGIKFYARGLYLLQATYDTLKIDEKEAKGVQTYMQFASSILNKLPKDKRKLLEMKKEEQNYSTEQNGVVMLNPYWLFFFEIHSNLSKNILSKSIKPFDTNQFDLGVREFKKTVLSSRRCTDPLKRNEYTISYKELKEAGVIS